MYEDTREDVLVVRMRGGQIESVTKDRRQVYETKGRRYIKTRGDGNIPVDDCNRAVISYRQVQAKMSSGRTMLVNRKVAEKPADVALALYALTLQFGLGNESG